MINFEIPIILAVIFLIALWWDSFWNWYLNRNKKDWEKDVIDSWGGK